MGRTSPAFDLLTKQSSSILEYQENRSRQRNLINKHITMKVALALCLLGLKAAQAVAPFELVVEEWETWKLKHGKTYAKNYGDNLVKGENYSQEPGTVWLLLVLLHHRGPGGHAPPCHGEAGQPVRAEPRGLQLQVWQPGL